MKKTARVLIVIIITSSACSCTNTSSEKDMIKSVRIGKQIWTVENLNTSTFQNGDLIPEAKSDSEWSQAGREHKPAWCYYNNNPANDKKYAKLYNWYAVNDKRGLSPKGWHVPTNKEWSILIDYVGGDSNAGNALKNDTGWLPYGNGKNSLGFSVLPAGMRDCDWLEGSFIFMGSGGEADFWTSDTNAIDFYFQDSAITHPWLIKGCGLSVRCIKD